MCALKGVDERMGNGLCESLSDGLCSCQMPVCEERYIVAEIRESIPKNYVWFAATSFMKYWRFVWTQC